jgi:hypothetical protein
LKGKREQPKQQPIITLSSAAAHQDETGVNKEKGRTEEEKREKIGSSSYSTTGQTGTKGS